MIDDKKVRPNSEEPGRAAGSNRIHTGIEEPRSAQFIRAAMNNREAEYTVAVRS